MKELFVKKNDIITLNNAIMYIKKYCEDSKDDSLIIIKKFSKKRSLDQNAFFHGIVLPAIIRCNGYNERDRFDKALFWDCINKIDRISRFNTTLYF